MNFGVILQSLISWATNTGIKIIIALILWIISFRIVNRIARKIEKKGEKDKYDKTLMKVLAYIFKISLKAVVVVCLIGYLGIDTSGITALLVSVGACVGLALNGALGNLAGGILIIITRPFRIDDFIEAQGVSGTVEDIHITCTKIRTPDNKVVYVPNGALSGGNIINYSEKDTRRVDAVFTVDYSTDCDKAISLIKEVIASDERILSDPAPFCKVTDHLDSAIAITARVWVKNDDFWDVKFMLLEKVKAAFDKNGIEIPFNQLDVHIKNS
jgi:small conductance mechanosensitive channel